MFNSTTFITLIGLALILCACSNQSIKESFVNYPRTAVSYPITCTNGNCQASNIDYKKELQKFVSYPSFQAKLSPRYGPPAGYGATIQYNLPSNNNLAVPQTPLGFGNMAKCNYTGNTVENYHDNKKPLMSYNQAISSVYNNNKVENISPNGFVGGVNDMTSLDLDGAAQQEVSYDRLIFSTAKSRLTAQGDWIRGDLPIVPNACGWFSPSVNPARDLNRGALVAMAGENDTSNKLIALVGAASALTAGTSAGGPTTLNYISPQSANKLNSLYNLSSSQNGSTIQVNNQPSLSALRTATGFA
jgi:hypothetical protein